MFDFILELLLFVLILTIVVVDFIVSVKLRELRRKSYISWRQKRECKEGFDALTHVHTEHWEYIQSVVPWRTRLRLSRFRGVKWALQLQIKLFSLFHGIGPKVAQWVLDEYMITTKVEDLPPPENTWVCPHCGTANQDTALFCKDCGEYK